MQDGKAEGTNQHDVAGGSSTVLPKHNGPSQQSDDQDDGHRGVEQAQFFQIQKAAPPRCHFPVNGRVEPAVFAADPAKRPHQRHVADDIHHFAINRRLCVLKTRFGNGGDEGRQGWAQIRCRPPAGWRDGSERLC